MKFTATFLALIVAPAVAVAAEQIVEDKYFSHGAGTFVAHDPHSGNWTFINKKRARQRYSPCSTYKVPHALIGLAAGVLKNAAHPIKYNAKKYPRETLWNADWAQDQTLTTAIRHSVVWYFQEVAQRIGRETMQEYVDKFKFGNRNIGGDIDKFWLARGRLKVSAVEQVEFWTKLYDGTLPVSPDAMETVREIVIDENTPEYILSGKTGTGEESDGTWIGWFVGALKKPKREPIIFSLNMDGANYEAVSIAKRKALTKQILGDLGF